jgi:hypothetical protein
MVLKQIPFGIFSNYENTLAFTVFCYGFLRYCKGNIFLGFFLALIACFIHASLLLFFVFMVGVHVLKRVPIIITIMIGCLIPIFLTLFGDILGSGIVNVIISKWTVYTEGAWSQYIRSEKLLYYFYIINLLILIPFIIKFYHTNDMKIRKLIIFFILSIPTLIYFLNFKTIAGRYIFNGGWFFILCTMSFFYSRYSTKYLYLGVILMIVLNPLNILSSITLINSIDTNILEKNITDMFLENVFINNTERDQTGESRI